MVSGIIHRRRVLSQLGTVTLGSVVLAAGAPASKRTVSIAAASNLTGLAQQLGDAFEQQTGIRTVFSFASTAQLARQLEDGAPFDVFAAADTTHVDQLAQKGVLVKGSRAVYATGILALWFPRGNGLRRLQDVADPGIRTIALARPELAPYGAAAVDALKKAGLWEKVQPRIVYASSVAMAKQYAVTGNADAVFTPKALVISEKGSLVEIEERLHQPLEQAVAVASSSKQQEAAGSFVQFLVRGRGHAILLAQGYK